MDSSNLAGGERTSDGEKIDSRTDSRNPVIYLHPLHISRVAGETMAYCKIEGSVFTFEGKDTDAAGLFGWVRVSGEGSKFDIPASGDLWKSRVKISDIIMSQSSTLTSSKVSGFIEEDTDIKNQFIKYTDRAETPFRAGFEEATFEKIVVNAFSVYQTRVAESPLSDVIRPRGPRGIYRKVYMQSAQVQSGTISHKETIEEFRSMLASQKQLLSLSGFQKAAKRAKDGVYYYGNIEQQGESVAFKDKNDEIIDKTTPFHKGAKIKSIEYPFCKPQNFKMSKKKFNALVSTTPSNILKPITTFIDSVEDIEEYSIGFILALWKTLNIFQK
jgi:hypothetical protein